MGPKRVKIFNQEYLNKHFGEEHKKAFGTMPPKGGYPDTGCGRYAQYLSYKEWVEINNANRAHYNFVEQIGVVIPLILIAGLYFPFYAAVIGAAHAVGRVIYTIGYVFRGADGRLPGAGICDIAILALFVLAPWSGYKFYQGATK
jgi:uncharacterized membrane protein YecN with MAPEG domain